MNQSRPKFRETSLKDTAYLKTGKVDLKHNTKVARQKILKSKFFSSFLTKIDNTVPFKF